MSCAAAVVAGAATGPAGCGAAGPGATAAAACSVVPEPASGWTSCGLRGFAGMWPAGTAGRAGALSSAGFRQSSISGPGCFPSGAVTGELVPAGRTELSASDGAVSGVDSDGSVCAGFGVGAAVRSCGAASTGSSFTVNATFDGCPGAASPAASGAETAAVTGATAECCGAGRAGLPDGAADGLESAGAGGAGPASTADDTGARGTAVDETTADAMAPGSVALGELSDA